MDVTGDEESGEESLQATTEKYSPQRRISGVPVRLVFSDHGVRYFQQKGYPLTHLTLSDEDESYGVELRSFSPPTVQKMIVQGYVRSVEISVADPRRVRNGVLDLTKLLVYAMLYAQVHTDLYENILESELAHLWNRQNPRFSIDTRKPLSSECSARLLEPQREIVKEMQRRVIAPAYARVSGSDQLSGEEREMRLTTAKRFLATIDGTCWVLAARYRDNSAADTWLETAGRTIARYVEKTVVAEYVALMIMELVQQLHIEAHELTPEGVAPDPVKLIWKVRKPGDFAHDHGRLSAVISNSTMNFERVRSQLFDRATREMSETLDDFYSKSQSGGALGMYYLAFVQDACKEYGIACESFASRTDRVGRALVNIQLQF